jgi:hypothetical protein
MAINFGFLDRSLYCPFKELLNYPHEAEWISFQTHCFSERSGRAGNQTRVLWICVEKGEKTASSEHKNCAYKVSTEEKLMN